MGDRAFDKISLSKRYLWNESQSINQTYDNFQFLGKKSDAITLTGLTFPYRSGKSGLSIIDEIEKEAAKGEPLEMFNARGESLGRWIITEASIDNSSFTADGYPRKISYNLTIKQWDGKGWTNI